MKKVILLLSCLLIAVTSVQSQAVFTGDDLRLKVTKILLKKDLQIFADELAKTKGNDVDSLLVRLDVFRRTGQAERIRQTLVQLSEASDLPPASERKWILDIVRPKISRDLSAYRFYYEHIVADDGYYHTNSFIGLWQSEGSEEELDSWLTKRSVVGNSWFTIRLERMLKRRTAQPILDELAAQVRQIPGDKQALLDYLSTVKHAQEYSSGLNRYLNASTDPKKDKHYETFENETNWLGDVFSLPGASENHDFGASVDQVNPSLAIKYYLESLAKPVTPQEVRLLAQKYPIHSNGPPRNIDWEKQLRYWTKQKLAAAYQRTSQAALAQPLIEELVTSKGDDIFTTEMYRLAGAVQSGSGARVVESKVLQDEATRSKSIEYWGQRVDYYEGRGESERVVQTFSDALANLPPQNRGWFAQRIGYSCQYRLRAKEDFEQLKPRLTQILLTEFEKVGADADSAIKIIKAASKDACDLSEFIEAIFIKRRDVLVPLFEKNAEWFGGESNILIELLADKRLSAEQKSFYFSELEKIASRGSLERRLRLAYVFGEIKEHPRRITLLHSYLKQASQNPANKAARESAARSLFDSYVETADWQSAEKLLLGNQDSFLPNWGNYLERLAICAGQQDSPKDAVRIWLKAVNFNGHSPFGLINLAETPAKPLLREYYVQMKRQDPSSSVPDAALKILR
jgi:hypothetical protein